MATVFGISYVSTYTKFQMSYVLRAYNMRPLTRDKKTQLIEKLQLLERRVGPESQVSQDIHNHFIGGCITELPVLHPSVPTAAAIPAMQAPPPAEVLAADAFPAHRPDLQLRECASCALELPPVNFPDRNITNQCTHAIEVCSECTSTFIQTQLDSVTHDQLSCPSCPGRLQYEDVRKFADLETFKRYDRILLMRSITGDPSYRPCLSPQCTSGQIQFEGDAAPIVTCSTCHHKSCFQHRVPWHSGQTCDQFDEANRRAQEQRAADENATAETIHKTTKACPQCGVNIEKTEGCDHMTCRQCRFQFCWICFTDWELIKRTDNSAHRLFCQYHTDNLLARAGFIMNNQRRVPQPGGFAQVPVHADAFGRPIPQPFAPFQAPAPIQQPRPLPQLRPAAQFGPADPAAAPPPQNAVPDPENPGIHPDW